MFGNKKPSPEQIAQGFRKRGLWITRFTIQGKEYGGDFQVEADRRIPQFFETFPTVRTILELGCLEGGQTFQLAKHADVQITAVEARKFNLEKARYVQQLLEVKNVKFVQADLEKKPLSAFGQFDAVFCSGLLYHLPQPWELLDNLWSASHRVFMWTHYAADNKVTETIAGFPGHWFQESGQADPLSGMSPKSFWITLPALINRLERNGFDHIKIIEDDRYHQNGPCVTLAGWGN